MKKVIISAPAKNEDVTLVLGVNAEVRCAPHHGDLQRVVHDERAGATVKVLLDNFGILKGQMTTIHAYTNSQRLLDMQSKDLREARAAAMNIVPTSTGAARALKLVIPEIEGKLDGVAYRVPTPTVSIVEIVALVKKKTTAEEVNDAMRKAAAESDEGHPRRDRRAARLDGPQGRPTLVDRGRADTNVVAGDLVKVASWYDNEWGYSCRTADLCAFVAAKGL